MSPFTAELKFCNINTSTNCYMSLFRVTNEWWQSTSSRCSKFVLYKCVFRELHGTHITSEIPLSFHSKLHLWRFSGMNDVPRATDLCDRHSQEFQMITDRKGGRVVRLRAPTKALKAMRPKPWRHCPKADWIYKDRGQHASIRNLLRFVQHYLEGQTLLA